MIQLVYGLSKKPLQRFNRQLRGLKVERVCLLPNPTAAGVRFGFRHSQEEWIRTREEKSIQPFPTGTPVRLAYSGSESVPFKAIAIGKPPPPKGSCGWETGADNSRVRSHDPSATVAVCEKENFRALKDLICKIGLK
ncbi:hypothetical protein TNCV_4995511 [Trichonephila clavipes]|nr:hypothetical protein TNCV_4995511 [Trichonephila clavipes]